jgi:hypothetical protein
MGKQTNTMPSENLLLRWGGTSAGPACLWTLQQAWVEVSVSACSSRAYLGLQGGVAPRRRRRDQALAQDHVLAHAQPVALPQRLHLLRHRRQVRAHRGWAALRQAVHGACIAQHARIDRKTLIAAAVLLRHYKSMVPH